MAEGSCGAVWFGAPGFEVLGVVDAGGELVVEVQTTATVVGCSRCGSQARANQKMAPNTNMTDKKAIR